MHGSTLSGILAQALADTDAPLCVAYSGGPDSTALLHALAHLDPARRRDLRAIHVDHGLHADSHDWARWCGRTCRQWDVPLDIRLVRVTPDGRGVEAAAREARYAALAEAMRPGEWLVTAHHRDDQAETVLLKLLRGAGPEGLAGMRPSRAFGPGRLWRPLLGTPRTALQQYLDAHHLECLDDPANRAPELARSHLRTDVMPRLYRHWPNATRAIAHAARLSAQADDYVQSRARHHLDELRTAPGQPLDAAGWLALHPALQGPVLDRWLYEHGLSAPSLGQRAQLQRQIRDAAPDRVPLVRWPGTAVHLWRGRLHAHPPLNVPSRPWQHDWHGEPLPLPSGGILALQPDGTRGTGTPVPRLQVTLGETGVTLRPVGSTHHRRLRLLYQEAGIPPWLRPLCPVIRDADGRLLAVADLWQTDAGQALFRRLHRQPAWRPFRPLIQTDDDGLNR